MASAEIAYRGTRSKRFSDFVNIANDDGSKYTLPDQSFQFDYLLRNGPSIAGPGVGEIISRADLIKLLPDVISKCVIGLGDQLSPSEVEGESGAYAAGAYAAGDVAVDKTATVTPLDEDATLLLGPTFYIADNGFLTGVISAPEHIETLAQLEQYKSFIPEGHRRVRDGLGYCMDEVFADMVSDTAELFSVLPGGNSEDQSLLESFTRSIETVMAGYNNHYAHQGRLMCKLLKLHNNTDTLFACRALCELSEQLSAGLYALEYIMYAKKQHGWATNNVTTLNSMVALASRLGDVLTTVFKDATKVIAYIDTLMTSHAKDSTGENKSALSTLCDPPAGGSDYGTLCIHHDILAYQIVKNSNTNADGRTVYIDSLVSSVKSGVDIKAGAVGEHSFIGTLGVIFREYSRNTSGATVASIADSYSTFRAFTAKTVSTVFGNGSAIVRNRHQVSFGCVMLMMAKIKNTQRENTVLEQVLLWRTIAYMASVTDCTTFVEYGASKVEAVTFATTAMDVATRIVVRSLTGNPAQVTSVIKLADSIYHIFKTAGTFTKNAGIDSTVVDRKGVIYSRNKRAYALDAIQPLTAAADPAAAANAGIAATSLSHAATNVATTAAAASAANKAAHSVANAANIIAAETANAAAAAAVAALATALTPAAVNALSPATVDALSPAAASALATALATAPVTALALAPATATALAVAANRSPALYTMNPVNWFGKTN